MKNPIQRLLAIIFLIILIIIVLEYGTELFFYVAHPASLREDVQPYMAIAPFIMIAIQILGILFIPLPDQGVTIASGLIFGTFFGSIIAYIGRLIGSSCAFFLGRQLGQPVIDYLLDKEQVKKFDKLISEKGARGLYPFYIAPFFPSDVISFTAGMSDLKFNKFFKVIVIGFIPHVLIIAAFGDLIGTLEWNAITLSLLVALVIISAGILLRHRIKAIFLKKSRF